MSAGVIGGLIGCALGGLVVGIVIGYFLGKRSVDTGLSGFKAWESSHEERETSNPMA